MVINLLHLTTLGSGLKMWTEKYRPNNLSEIVGHMEFFPIWDKWVENKDLPHLIISGPAGIGKTTLGVVLAKEILEDDFALNFLELNASDDRKLEVVRTKIKGFATTRKMGFAPFKICLLDEMDGMTNDAQNALKRIMEKYSANVRFVITTNYLHKIVAPIQSRCVVQKLGLVDKYAIRGLLSTINDVEGGQEREIDVISTFANGDVRKAISMLENGNNESEDNSDYFNILTSNKDEMLDKLQELITKGTSITEVCRGLHDAVIDNDIESKFKYLRVIGELEYRSPTITPRIGISWLVSQV